MKNVSLPDLKAKAAAALNDCIPGIKSWIDQVRDERPGRLKWAVQTTRDANVAATAYVLGGLCKMGLLDDVWTPADRDAAVAWVEAMHTANGQYHDPALLDRRSPDWPADEPWPSAAMRTAANQYALNVIKHSRGANAEYLGLLVPPPSWPQKTDDPATIVDWIKTRPYHENAWGACSHGMRMATWMLQWHEDGCFGLGPVIEALQFFYDIQDPETGLWGTVDQKKHVRINGTFKLFPLIREQLDLPLPYADRVIDQVLTEFDRPDYDESVGGCDEWDNWYVLALALEPAGGHRREEVLALAARRIARVLHIFRQPDGGLSFFPDRCNSNWVGFDMAPGPIAQADAMAPGILASGINVCIDLLGLHEASPWTGAWRLRPQARASDGLRDRILAGLRLPQ